MNFCHYEKIDLKYLKKKKRKSLYSHPLFSRGNCSFSKNENRDFYIPATKSPKLREPRFRCGKHDTRMHLGSTPVTLTRRANKANASHESGSESARCTLVIRPARLSVLSDANRLSATTFGSLRGGGGGRFAVKREGDGVRWKEGRRE